MDNQQGNPNDPGTQQSGSDDQSKGPNWRNLEKARDNALDWANAWKNVALQGLVQGAGFDPTDPVVGLVVEKFNTDDLDPTELSPKSFVDFAKDYGVQPPSNDQSNQGGDPNQDHPDPTTQAQIQQMQGQQPPQQPGQQPGQAQTPPTDPNAMTPADQYQRFQAPADALMTAAAGNPATSQPQDPASQVQRAEAEGRWGDSFQGKFNLTRQAFNQGQVPGQAPQQQVGQVNPTTGLPTHTPQQ